ncbi:annexin A13 isoform X2 [Dendrobium catenatum]|uniref:annexin A13 isoform X2 n=1 Tax=Dendrobium catenatum TaxID=906689 RepID=UPI0009F578BD|nr:annexin A13 isoform X2 [Dendrobium catenatum]
MLISSQSFTSTLPTMVPSSSVTVDRYDEKVCREIFANQNQPNHLVLVLAGQSSDEKRQIKELYRAIHGEELVELLLRIKEANPESEPVYFGLWLWMMEQPERDAVVAKDAVERGSADDYKAIVEIYVRRKSSHLFASKQAYFAKCRSHMDKDILSVEPEHPGPKALEDRSGNFEDSLRVVIQCMCTPYEYYSEMIYMSLVAEVDKKVVLTRVMIGSVEVGMNKVKEAFQMRYKVKLEEAIVERVLDDDNYRDFLVALSNASG